MAAFIPTHYTAYAMLFFASEDDPFGRMYGANEAVAAVERANGRFKVICADGLFAGCHASEIYQGPRRDLERAPVSRNALADEESP